MMTSRLRLFFLFACMAVAIVPHARAAVVIAGFGSATDVPVFGHGYTASGNSVNLGLGFAPVTGATLMVVKNTGIDFILGTFNNLAQGQRVTLTYGGAAYDFVANYYGGTGNDLVLQWADTRVMDWGAIGMRYGLINNASDSSVPVEVNATGVLAGKTVIALASGGAHNLALCADGTLAAWGYNAKGQLGNNSTTDSDVPVLVDVTDDLAGKRVVAIAAAGNHSVALCSDGMVAAWGGSSTGELDTNSAPQSLVPIAVPVTAGGVLSGRAVVAIAAGESHTLLLCSDGTLAAWGYNRNGQLGDGSGTSSTVPVAVSKSGPLSSKKVIAIAAGGNHSLALCSDGTLAAWGLNGQGQLGNNTYTTVSAPVAVSTSGVLAGKAVVSVSAGANHTLALCSDGTVGAWGYNFSGQLGNNGQGQISGGIAYSPVPVAIHTFGVLAGKKVMSLAGGQAHSLALCSDGTVAAWGYNFYGQVGNNTQIGTLVPVAVNTSALGEGDRFASVAAGPSAYQSLALLAKPPTHFNELSDLALSIGTLDPAFASETTTYTVSVARAISTIRLTPSLAVSSATVKINGVAVPSDTAAGDISFGYGETEIRCVVTPSDGSTARTYTVIVSRALPDNALTANFNAPTDVPLTCEGFTATGNSVDLSLNHTPAVAADLTIVKNIGLRFITGTFSNLGEGQSVALAFGGHTYNFVASYFGGTGNDLVLHWAGTMVMGWGANSNGQLGNHGTTDSHVAVAASTSGVLAGRTVVSVSNGGSHSLALCSDGTLAAWGLNTHGELGYDSNNTKSDVPVAVSTTGVLAGKTVVAISAGISHSLALCSDGTMAAWGPNYVGQLGNGGTDYSTNISHPRARGRVHQRCAGQQESDCDRRRPWAFPGLVLRRLAGGLGGQFQRRAGK